eukprot:gene11292-7825_t
MLYFIHQSIKKVEKKKQQLINKEIQEKKRSNKRTYLLFNKNYIKFSSVSLDRFALSHYPLHRYAQDSFLKKESSEVPFFFLFCGVVRRKKVFFDHLSDGGRRENKTKNSSLPKQEINSFFPPTGYLPSHRGSALSNANAGAEDTRFDFLGSGAFHFDDETHPHHPTVVPLVQEEEEQQEQQEGRTRTAFLLSPLGVPDQRQRSVGVVEADPAASSYPRRFAETNVTSRTSASGVSPGTASGSRPRFLFDSLHPPEEDDQAQRSLSRSGTGSRGGLVPSLVSPVAVSRSSRGSPRGGEPDQLPCTVNEAGTTLGGVRRGTVKVKSQRAVGLHRVGTASVPDLPSWFLRDVCRQQPPYEAEEHPPLFVAPTPSIPQAKAEPTGHLFVEKDLDKDIDVVVSLNGTAASFLKRETTPNASSHELDEPLFVPVHSRGEGDEAFHTPHNKHTPPPAPVNKQKEEEEAPSSPTTGGIKSGRAIYTPRNAKKKVSISSSASLRSSPKQPVPPPTPQKKTVEAATTMQQRPNRGVPQSTGLPTTVNGGEVGGTANFGPHCGAKYIRPNAKFCSQCGKRKGNTASPRGTAALPTAIPVASTPAPGQLPGIPSSAPPPPTLATKRANHPALPPGAAAGTDAPSTHPSPAGLSSAIHRSSVTSTGSSTDAPPGSHQTSTLPPSAGAALSKKPGSNRRGFTRTDTKTNTTRDVADPPQNPQPSARPSSSSSSSSSSSLMDGGGGKSSDAGHSPKKQTKKTPAGTGGRKTSATTTSTTVAGDISSSGSEGTTTSTPQRSSAKSSAHNTGLFTAVGEEIMKRDPDTNVGLPEGTKHIGVVTVGGKALRAYKSPLDGPFYISLGEKHLRVPIKDASAIKPVSEEALPSQKQVGGGAPTRDILPTGSPTTDEEPEHFETIDVTPEQREKMSSWATLKPGELTPQMLMTENSAELSGWKKGTLIGRGTYGSVYLGLLADGSFYAVKCVELGKEATEAINPAELVSLFREINLMQRLKHKNLCEFKGVWYDEQERHICMFMQYIGGGSLTSFVKKFKPLPPDVIRTWTKQLLSGLRYLHSQRIIHRDIKGENVLVDTAVDPTSGAQIKLVDFGAARRLTDAVSQSKTVIGTPYWMAPEVVDFSGEGEGYSFKADVWSVGCTVAEMLTGSPPWPIRANAPSTIMMIANAKDGPTAIPEKEATPGCLDFMKKCFAVDPNKRPTVEELLKHPWIVGTME